MQPVMFRAFQRVVVPSCRLRWNAANVQHYGSSAHLVILLKFFVSR